LFHFKATCYLEKENQAKALDAAGLGVAEAGDLTDEEEAEAVPSEEVENDE
jgi:predicted transcriptional regulator